MAEYIELNALPSDEGFEDFIAKLRVAVTVKAAAVINEPTSTASQKAWASRTLIDPRSSAEELFWYVIAINASASVSQILDASDALIQSNINDAVDASV